MSDRPTDEQYRKAAQDTSLVQNDPDFDDYPIVSHGDGGAYVACWIWISDEVAEQQEK